MPDSWYDDKLFGWTRHEYFECIEHMSWNSRVNISWAKQNFILSRSTRKEWLTRPLYGWDSSGLVHYSMRAESYKMFEKSLNQISSNPNFNWNDELRQLRSYFRYIGSLRCRSTRPQLLFLDGSIETSTQQILKSHSLRCHPWSWCQSKRVKWVFCWSIRLKLIAS